MILVKRLFAHNELRNYSYLLINKGTKKVWIIDPYNSEDISDYILNHKLDPVAILNTHQHHDHIRGNNKLLKAFSLKVERFETSPTFCLMGEVDLCVGNKDHSARQLKNSQAFLKVYSAPGHTLDHVIFVLTENNKDIALFSGDTVFNAGVGNCKGGGDVGLLYETIKQIKKLPSHLTLYPGHDYIENNMAFASRFLEQSENFKKYERSKNEVKTLGEEFQVNPFFLTSDVQFRQMMISLNKDLQENSSDKEFFKMLRKLRDQW